MRDPNRESDIPPSSRKRLPSGALRLHAPAKINLNLLVGPLREDGYHPVDSCVAKITLYDSLELRRRDDGLITLTCQGMECGPVEDNLAYRAAMLLADLRSVPGADITLVKQIPPGGGLGGGSSDAASVLAGLNELWNLNLSEEALGMLAAKLGCDVPLFLGPPACHVTGRGEILAPLEVYPFWAVLILPTRSCATAQVYQAFDAEKPASPQPLSKDVFIKPPSRWRDRLVNQLTPAAWSVCPPLRELHEQLSASLNVPVGLTGSGSALFVLCDTADEARQTRQALPEAIRAHCRIVQRNAW